MNAAFQMLADFVSITNFISSAFEKKAQFGTTLV